MRMKDPIISVIMSVYNSEEYLAEAIESIISQTFTDFEFILINDGSDDNSLDIIKLYMGKDGRLILINRENKGLPASLNEGIAQAKGKYIARMDADDIALPERLQAQYNFMESNPKVDVCGSFAQFFGASSRVARPYTTNKDIAIHALFACPMVHPTVIAKKSFFNILYNTDFFKAQDYELWTRGITQGYVFANINQVLMLYRVRSGVNSSSEQVFFSAKARSKYIESLNLLDEKERQNFMRVVSAREISFAFLIGLIYFLIKLNIVFRGSIVLTSNLVKCFIKAALWRC
ncbi:glycosyltransferase [Stutzerimonas nitrititolerans]|uniref:glycosyltransferase n=1 Tax=Stutzerimonas nitrititolerans TaxID=2482751 RepID=UPI003F7F960B